MKKTLLLILLVIILFFENTFAHSGRTDKNGGHYNRKTGQYHTHNVKSGVKAFIMVIIIGGVLLYVTSSKKRE